jgi:hypothetical protein
MNYLHSNVIAIANYASLSEANGRSEATIQSPVTLVIARSAVARRGNLRLLKSYAEIAHLHCTKRSAVQVSSLRSSQ